MEHGALRETEGPEPTGGRVALLPKAADCTSGPRDSVAATALRWSAQRTALTVGNDLRNTLLTSARVRCVRWFSLRK